MKIIIDIPKSLYEECKKLGDKKDTLFEAIRNGTLLFGKNYRKFRKIIVKRLFEKKPYFLIEYEKDGELFVGFGSYSLDVVSEYIRDYFVAPIDTNQMKKVEDRSIKDMDSLQKERDEDRKFLVDIIFQIKDYAKTHGMEPDDTIKRIAENMLALLQIATFNGGDEDADSD